MRLGKHARAPHDGPGGRRSLVPGLARRHRRAAGRIERNTTKPYVGVRVAGQQFDRIKAVAAPESVERVAHAMADKYWSDVLVRHMDHPLTMRLAPE